MQSDIDKIELGAGERLFGWQTAYDYQTQVWLWRFRFHKFMREDPGEAHHDHPWWFITFPLDTYVEDVLDVKTGKTERVIVEAFRFHYRPKEYTHRIIGLWNGNHEFGRPVATTKEGPIRTLVLRGPVEREFSYWRFSNGKAHRFPWRSYLTKIERRPARPR